MSSSEQKPRPCRVILDNGALGPAEFSLGQLESGRSRLMDEALEAEFYERIKVKAAAKARDILAQAMAEAADIREQARLEGQAQAEQEAVDQLEAARKDMGNALARALDAVGHGKKEIWRAHRAELAELIRLAVEKVVGVQFADEKRKILSKLLDQAAKHLDQTQPLILRLNPEDEPVMREILSQELDKFPSLAQWSITPDPSLEPGGLIVESDQGMIDNSIEARLAGVMDILEQLSLPDAEPNDP